MLFRIEWVACIVFGLAIALAPTLAYGWDLVTFFGGPVTPFSFIALTPVGFAVFAGFLSILVYGCVSLPRRAVQRLLECQLNTSLGLRRNQTRELADFLEPTSSVDRVEAIARLLIKANMVFFVATMARTGDVFVRGDYVGFLGLACFLSMPITMAATLPDEIRHRQSVLQVFQNRIVASGKVLDTQD